MKNLSLPSPPLLALLGALTVATAAHPAQALTADLGSTGADGPLNVTEDTVVPLPVDGVLHHTTIHIAEGATLRFSYAGIAHPGVVLLATGDMTIDGTLDVSGEASTPTTAGRAGPGGSPGGAPSTTSANLNYAPFDPGFLIPNEASAHYGLRPQGGIGGYSSHGTNCTVPGSGGGGGGGSLVLFSNTRISGAGRIDAGGGLADPTPATGCSSGVAALSTSGEDGRIRISAPTINLAGATVIAHTIVIGTISLEGNPAVQRRGTSGNAALVTGLSLVRFPTLPTATIVGLNGTPVAPSSTIQVPSTTANPWTVLVRVEGCTASQLTAAVHSCTGDFDRARGQTTLSSPTGNDEVAVSINTQSSPTGYRRQAVLLFPAVWCGPPSSP